MEKYLRECLIHIATAYAHKHGFAMTTVARRFHGTDSFFKDFAKGKRSITLSKLDEMINAFELDWAAGKYGGLDEKYTARIKKQCSGDMWSNSIRWPNGIRWPAIETHLYKITGAQLKKHDANQELTH